MVIVLFLIFKIVSRNVRYNLVTNISNKMEKENHKKKLEMEMEYLIVG